MASAACAVHCLAAPLLLLFVPVLGGWWSHPAAHWLLAGLVLPLAGWVVLRGYQKHRRRVALVAVALGGGLVLAGAVLPHLDSPAAQAAVRLGPAPGGAIVVPTAAAAVIPDFTMSQEPTAAEAAATQACAAGGDCPSGPETCSSKTTAEKEPGETKLTSALAALQASPEATVSECETECTDGGACANDAAALAVFNSADPIGIDTPPAVAVAAIDTCCPSVAFDAETGRASVSLPAGSLVTILGSLFLVLAHGINLHGCRCASRDAAAASGAGCGCLDK